MLISGDLTELRMAVFEEGVATRRQLIVACEANSTRSQLQPVAAGAVTFRVEPVTPRGKALVLRRRRRELVYEREPAAQ